jgi:hypothetical protein
VAPAVWSPSHLSPLFAFLSAPKLPCGKLGVVIMSEWWLAYCGVIKGDSQVVRSYCHLLGRNGNKLYMKHR